MSVLLLTDASTDRMRRPGNPNGRTGAGAAADGVRDAAGNALLEGPASRRRRRRAGEPASIRPGSWPRSTTRRRGAAAGSMPTRTSCRDRCRRPGWRPAPRSAARGPQPRERRPSHSRSCGRPATTPRASEDRLLPAEQRSRRRGRAAAEGLAQRIAMVDWDVHHGDGTQAIFDADADLCYTSTHQSPFYPGTGARASAAPGPREGTKHNVPLPPGSGDEAFTEAWRGSCCRPSRPSRRRRSWCRPATTRRPTTRWPCSR